MSEPVGYIVAVEPGVVNVALLRKDEIAKYDYVYFMLKDKIEGKLMPVKVIGQIIDVRRTPYRISTEAYVADVIEFTPQDSLIEVIVGRVLVLGYRYNGTILRPKTTPPVGTPVYLASDKDIEELVKLPPDRGLHIGSLVTRPTIPVSLDVYGLRRHLAIIAATGSGKTWTSILLIEELLRKGATIVVIDPHGEYVPIKDTIHRLGPEYRDAVTVLKVAPYQIGERKYRVSLASIDSDTLAAILRIPTSAAKMRYALTLTHKLLKAVRRATGNRRVCTLRNLMKLLRLVAEGNVRNVQNILSLLGVKANKDVYGVIDEKSRRVLENLISELKEFSEDKRNKTAAVSVLIRLRKLKSLGVYTYFSTPLDVLLRPRHITIVNLAGVSDEVQDHVAYHILDRILKARVRYVRKLRGPKYPYPVVVVVEEAHRFAPSKSVRGTLWSRDALIRIACEGRKFGVYLIVITQRPSRIDSDVLSQCNSQIILRLVNPRDIDAVMQSSELVDAEISKLIPHLNVGEAIVLGPVAPLPVVVKLRDRALEYGGGDIDLVSEWSRSIQARFEFERKFCNIVEKILDAKISMRDVRRALLEAASVESYDVDGNVLSGTVRGAYVEIRLGEGSWSCSKCSGTMLTPCIHVLTLLAKAYVDGKLRLEK